MAFSVIRLMVQFVVQTSNSRDFSEINSFTHHCGKTFIAKHHKLN